MKKINSIISVLMFSVILFSCEKDAGKLPIISFKTGGSYTSADATIAGGTNVTFGINASKAESKEVLKQFNVSKSINGAAATTVFTKSLTGSEGDTYTYDYSATLESVSGQKNTYTFTVTNRDGLVNQVSATITIQ